MRRTRRALLLIAWLAFLGASVAVSVRIGRGPLAAPPVSEGMRGLSTWLRDRTAAQATFAVVRMLVVSVGVWLLATTVLEIAALAIHAARLERWLSHVTARSVRRACQAAFGISLAAATVLSPGDRRSPASASGADVPTMVKLARDVPDPDTTGTQLPTDPPPTMTAVPTEEPPSSAPAVAGGWTVGPGDSFWSIAATLLGNAWAREPTDREIDPFWRALIARNRAVLVDPDNPDLIYPAQVLSIGAVPQAP